MRPHAFMLTLAIAAAALPAVADIRPTGGEPATEADTLRVLEIEEVVVVATPKEGTALRRMPIASTSLSHADMVERGIEGITDLSAHTPNVFIPDYGSRLTTGVYVRGIGSRIGTPAVALYVDGVPQPSAASYDFNYSGVDRIDVLRGPQGTLYGRGAMGGVVRVFTKNPFHYQGTELDLDAAMPARGYRLMHSGRHAHGNGRGRLSLTHYHRVSDRFAFSANLFYHADGGYFRNEGRHDELIDDQQDAGTRLRFGFRPSSTFHADLTVSHEWTRQGGYPYEYRGTAGTPTTPEPLTQPGQIAYDNRSSYRRNLTNVGLTAGQQWEHTELTSVTGFQHLHDRMALDQDFTTTDLYTLTQRQNLNMLTEELVLKRRPDGSDDHAYDWLLGASVAQQWTRTDGPVEFHADGLAWLNGIINRQGNAHMPVVPSYDADGNEAYSMHFLFSNTIEGSDLAFPGTYRTPSTNAALFHQSIVHRLLGVDGLTLRAGLRGEVEHFSLHYDAHYAFRQTYGLGGRLVYPDGSVWRDGMTLVPTMGYMVSDELSGHLSKTAVQLLPQVSITWHDFYASLSRGHRSGGYNIQLFSDLLQARMQTAIMHNVANATVPVVEAVNMIPADVKQTVRQMLIDMGTQGSTDVEAATWYKPETSWNVEAGTHQTLCEGRVQADATLFWMETRDQQVSRMSAGGLGRITVNNGRSRSIGGELSLRTRPAEGLTLHVAYGYTNARFRSAGRKCVPFVPRNTLSAGVTQEWTVGRGGRRWVDAVRLHAGYRGAGRIYWTEANNAWQDFAGELDARLTVVHDGQHELPASLIAGQQQLTHHSRVELSVYARNILGTRRQTFYFETMQRAFAQYARPIEIGANARLSF